MKVNSEFLRELSDKIESERPDHRKITSIDLQNQCAFVLPDLSLFPSMLLQCT